MQIDWWTLGLQAVNFLVLVWILSRFLFRPVTAIIAERRTAATKALDEARAVKKDAEAERQKTKEERANLSAQRADLVQQATTEAAKEKAALLAKARAETEEMRKAAREEIERNKQAEQHVLEDRASHLAVDIATRLMDRLPEAARISGFIEGLANAVEKLPEQTRADLGKEGAPLHIKAPRMLTEQEQQTCRELLSKALGQPVEISLETDPRIIAGLELETPHAAVRNSFRADLDRIEAELTRHES